MLHHDLLSESDRTLLEKFRLARFQNCLPSLQSTVLYLDSDSWLNIFCPTSESVDATISVQAEIEAQAAIILGCDRLRVWFEKECIAESTITELNFISEAIAFVEDSNPMATATLETNIVSSQVKQQVSEAIAPVIDEAIDQTLNQFASNGELTGLIQERVQARVSQWIGSLKNLSTPAPAAETPAAAPTESTPKAPEAPFKIVSAYGDTLYNALMALIPEMNDRQTMLKAIEKGQKKGTEWIDANILPHYPEKQRTRAKASLLKKSSVDKARLRLMKTK